MLIGSDGLWEFISNQQILTDLKDEMHKKDLDVICEKLLEHAKIKWAKNEEMVDDITFIAVFINEPVHMVSITMEH